MTPRLNIKSIDNKEYILCMVRKKFVYLTPEEWVRQHFLFFITEIKKYPLSMIAVEKLVQVGSLKKRFDILIHKNALPWMIVECKSENIEFKAQILSQILSYNSVFKTKYLVISNGRQHYCYDTILQTWNQEIPDY